MILNLSYQEYWRIMQINCIWKAESTSKEEGKLGCGIKEHTVPGAAGMRGEAKQQYISTVYKYPSTSLTNRMEFFFFCD